MKKRILATLQLIGIAFIAASCSENQSEVVTIANELNIFKSYQITQNQTEKLIAEVESYVASRDSQSNPAGKASYTVYFEDVETYPHFEGKVNVSVSSINGNSSMTIVPEQLILKTSDSKAYSYEGAVEVRDVYVTKTGYRKEVAIRNVKLIERLDSKGTVRPFSTLNFTYLYTRENDVEQMSTNELIDAAKRRGLGSYSSPSGEIVEYYVSVRLPIQKVAGEGSYVKGTLNFIENKVELIHSQPIVAQYSKYGEQTITLISSIGTGQNLPLSTISGL